MIVGRLLRLWWYQEGVASALLAYASGKPTGKYSQEREVTLISLEVLLRILTCRFELCRTAERGEGDSLFSFQQLRDRRFSPSVAYLFRWAQTYSPHPCPLVSAKRNEDGSVKSAVALLCILRASLWFSVTLCVEDPALQEPLFSLIGFRTTTEDYGLEIAIYVVRIVAVEIRRFSIDFRLRLGLRRKIQFSS